MWVATIDFMKAFDSITPKSVWDARESCGIEHGYSNFLKKLYKNMKGNVMTDEESDMFQIKKGTQQGHPCSSTLFCKESLKDDLPYWQKKRGMGICLGDRDHRTNMRVADDVLQLASSEEQLQKMMCGTEKAIHLAKTKILSNQSSNSRKDMVIDKHQS